MIVPLKMNEKEDDVPAGSDGLSPQKRRDIEKWLAENESMSSSQDSNKSPSPVLCEKRPATSPVIGINRKKRIRLVSKSKLKQLNDKEVKAGPSTVDQPSEHVADSAHLKIWNLNTDFSSLDLSHHTENEKCNILLNSQPIETASSEEKSRISDPLSIVNTSDSDKTVSDFIEEACSPACRKKLCLSQNISEPDSQTSSESPNLDKQRTITNVSSTTLECSLNLIQNNVSSSTKNSKNDLTSAIYIPQIVPEEKKRKKNPKKGSLLELLFTSLQKETSNTRILKHQVLRKPNDVSGLQFVILHVLQELPMLNGNQLFKCSIIQDTNGLLNNLARNSNRELNFLTVIVVPEISGSIVINDNVNLKVYQPLNILNSQERLVHISKFVLIKDTVSINNNHKNSNSDVDCNDIDNNSNGQLNSIIKFNCPCIDKRHVSITCNTKFKNCTVDVYNEFFL